MSNSSDATQKCCKICGDSAGCGINFGCFSCESCKAFFRRCSVRAQSLKCPFSGHCRITKVSRRACQACRLSTCLKNGMRKELVDVWKRVRAVSPVEGRWEEGIGIGEHIGQKQRQIRRKVRKVCGCCGCKCEEGRQTAEKGTQTDVQQTKDAVLDKESFSTLSPSSPTLSRPLEDVHQLLLDELIRANGVLDAPLRVPHQHVLPFNLTLVDALRVSEWAMRRMVVMSKQLGAFRSLPQSDQIVLLRAGLVQLLILRGAMAFDPVNEVWRHALLSDSDGPHPFMLNLTVLPATEQHYQDHKRFLLTFGEQWRTDRNVMLILQAIVLFCPPPEALISREVIRANRERYCELLMRYLDGIGQSAQGAETAYAHLMAKLDELVSLNSSFQRIYLQLNQSELEPLFRELFAAK
uniref:Uncharacterized protein n=1 Tax=Globodera rostochiensis TaxID=31243 RepID=A0A914GQ10_GLORO